MGIGKPNTYSFFGFLTSVFLLHFVVFYPFGFPLTVAPFFIAYFFLSHFYLKIQKIAIFNILLLASLPLIVLAFNVGSGALIINNFFRTYSLWLFAILIVVLVVTAHIKRIEDYRHASTVAIYVIGLYSIIQVAEVYIFGTTSLYYPFGEFSYLNQTDTSRFVMDGSIRANSFYLEPSFSAFVIFFLLTVYLMYPASNKSRVSLLVAAFIFLLVIGSAAGIFALLGLALLEVIVNARHKRLGLILLLICFPIVIYIVIAHFGNRLIEIGVEGSSGYWRLIAPLQVMVKAFDESPIGIPLGQISDFVFNLGIKHGQSIGSSIDNGLFVILFNFGILALLFFFFAGLIFIMALLKARREEVIFFWFLFIGLQFSGAIYTPEFLVAIVLVIYAYRCGKLVSLHSRYPMEK